LDLIFKGYKKAREVRKKTGVHAPGASTEKHGFLMMQRHKKSLPDGAFFRF
jgi:hypothetical protein